MIVRNTRNCKKMYFVNRHEQFSRSTAGYSTYSLW